MYGFRHDKSRDRVFFEIIYEYKLKEQKQLLTVISEIYTEHEMCESLKEIEKDFDEYWAKFYRLKKEKGTEFKYQDVADNLPNNSWPGIVKENIKRDIMVPDQYLSKNYQKMYWKRISKNLSEKILKWKSEHKIQ
jgi:hypothetical protein